MLKLKSKKLEEYAKFVDIIDNLKLQGHSVKEIETYLNKKYPMYNAKTIFVKYYTKFKDVDNSTKEKIKYFNEHKININA